MLRPFNCQLWQFYLTRRTEQEMGYTEDELKSIPNGSNLGLGCGNPVALASLKEGETVIDLGSGGGVDCFLAARKVGAKGNVIGIDMAPAMIDKARENARKGNYKNVEFKLGEIEKLPVADDTADIIISNCVINLTPDKHRVYKEAFRALKPGGRLMVSDIVLAKELPAAITESAHPASCLQEAMMKDKYLETIEQAGFQDVRIVDEIESRWKICCARTRACSFGCYDDPILTEALAATMSISVSAVKPLR